MKINLPKLGLTSKKKTAKEVLKLELPITLYPLSAMMSTSNLGEIINDYDIQVLSSVPKDFIKSFDDEKIELDIANPHVFITFDRDKGIYSYVVVEPPLKEESFTIYLLLERELERKLLNEGEDISIGKVVKDVATKNPELKMIEGRKSDYLTLSIDAKVAIYYFLRNLTGYNIFLPLISDYKLEDISINGLDVPVYVYHRDYEYMPTNITFTKNMKILNYTIDGEELLDQLILRLISISGKSISIAEPIADGMLPAGDRIAATFRREVSARGSTFVIRKYSESPITILDLINSGVISADIAAYLWYAMDVRLSFMVLGVTGAGKTTTLNAILNLVRENMKIVTIEDIPEIKIAHDNWIQLFSRPAYAGMGKEISLMDLLKLSLRYRPDLIVVGEIRGEEAYVLFQAISTGHGGATTFHAHDTDSAIKRLINEPLNIPKEWIPMMNIIMTVRRVPIYTGDKVILRRRIVAVDEILAWNDYRRVATWEPNTDKHTFDIYSAKVLEARANEAGISLDEVKNELERRAYYLKLLASIRDIVQSPQSYREVKKYIIKYELNPITAVKEVERLAATKKIIT
ncbi:MAG: type II/IV secretion system ATPase subunit [Sulfolobaceae archaeon]|nr:type II/IV secretion system ATPase subunit [Sulfolobaceae archaeon]